MTKFKKGDLITLVTGNHANGNVSTEDFLVRSWGVKQACLIKLDGTNAEFRLYTSGQYRVTAILTADYTEEFALAFGEQMRAAAMTHAVGRKMHRISYDGGMHGFNEFEMRVYAENVIDASQPARVSKW